MLQSMGLQSEKPGVWRTAHTEAGRPVITRHGHGERGGHSRAPRPRAPVLPDGYLFPAAWPPG